MRSELGLGSVTAEQAVWKSPSAKAPVGSVRLIRLLH